MGFRVALAPRALPVVARMRASRVWLVRFAQGMQALGCGWYGVGDWTQGLGFRVWEACERFRFRISGLEVEEDM
jgi:hypothetical protein